MDNKPPRLSPPSSPSPAALLEAEAHRLFEAGNVAEALALQREAATSWHGQNDLRRAAHCTHVAGFLQFLLRDHTGAIASYEAALALRTSTQDSHGELASLCKLAQVYQHLGDHAKALSALRRSLELCAQAGRRKDMGTVLNNMGVSLTETGQRDEAMQAYRRALEIRREVDDAAGLAVTLQNLASLYIDKDQYEDARVLAEEAMRICRAIGDEAQLGRTALCLGRLCEGVGNLDEAAKCYEHALRLARRPAVNSRDDEAVALHNLGALSIALGNPAAALQFLGQAQCILSASGMNAGLAMVYYNSAAAHRMLGQTAQALDALGNARAILEQIGDRRGLAIALAALGEVLSERGVHDQACDALTAAIPMQAEMRDYLAQGNSHSSLARICELQGKADEAARHYRCAAFLLEHAGSDAFGMDDEACMSDLPDTECLDDLFELLSDLQTHGGYLH